MWGQAKLETQVYPSLRDTLKYTHISLTLAGHTFLHGRGYGRGLVDCGTQQQPVDVWLMRGDCAGHFRFAQSANHWRSLSLPPSILLFLGSSHSGITEDKHAASILFLMMKINHFGWTISSSFPLWFSLLFFFGLFHWKYISTVLKIKIQKRQNLQKRGLKYLGRSALRRGGGERRGKKIEEHPCIKYLLSSIYSPKNVSVGRARPDRYHPFICFCLWFPAN